MVSEQRKTKNIIKEDKVMKLNEMEKKAVEKIAEEKGFENDVVELYLDKDIITINKCRNGRYVAWYIGENEIDEDVCIYVDTLEELDSSEIERELL